MGALILVVEDEAVVADDIQQTLLELGYEVPVPYATGRDAVDAAAALMPQLVLMDIKLRGQFDGIQAAEIIRREHNIPVVYLTSHSDEVTLTRATATRPYGYLLKPFTDRDLRTAIEVALQLHTFETQVSDRQRWLTSTLSCLGEALIATDNTETITFINTAAMAVTGWQASTALGRPFDEVFQLVAPSDAYAESDAGAAVQLHRRNTLVARGGARIEVEHSTAPIVDATRGVVGRVVVFRDVTERKKLERQLIQSERVAALGRVASGMGHEINNPLMAIVGNIGFATETVQLLTHDFQTLSLECEPCAPPGAIDQLIEVTHCLNDADDAAERMRQLSLRLTMLNNSEASSRVVTTLPRVLDLAADLAMVYIGHDLKLFKAYGITPNIEVNEDHLSQVFAQLIVNAAQAFRSAPSANQYIRLTTSTDPAGRAVATVSDNGPGIPAHLLKEIFDPFYTTKTFEGGLGLGLAFSHGIIAGLGGEIVAESILGHGADFSVTLPSAPDQAVPASVTIDGARLRRGKLLIVDDDAKVARALGRMLQRENHVTLVTTGIDALSQLSKDTLYDAIFCDLEMPGMSGVQVYETVAAVNRELARRFVFMTGGTNNLHSKAFLEATGNAVILKPFDSSAVMSIARDFVRKARAVREDGGDETD